MEYLIIIGIVILFLIILKFAWNIKLTDIKKIKEIGYDNQLNKITNKLPENREICKTILKKVNNEKVQIKESVEEENKTSLYIVLSNSIIIANIQDTFSRVQTIAHECLHSIQNRRTLLFNFFFSNVYFIYFIGICILSIFKLIQYPMIHLFVLTIFSFIYYAIRSYLEMDAMIKAKPLTEEYLKEEGSLSQEEQSTIIENCGKINQIAIKLTNYNLIFNCSIKIIIYAFILLVR